MNKSSAFAAMTSAIFMLAAVRATLDKTHINTTPEDFHIELQHSLELLMKGYDMVLNTTVFKLDWSWMLK